MKFSTHNNNSSFTLIELLVVLALVAILSVVVILTLNPAELLKQARDSNRLSDLATINTALNLFSTDVIGGFMGTSTIVYTSLVNTVNPATTTCSGMGLPTLPTGWTYNCPTSTQSLRNTDGTGWIPVNFQRISSNSPISQLPIDPQNTSSTKYYTYVTGGSWQLAVKMESAKYQANAYSSGGADPSTYTAGNNLSLAPFVGGLVGWWKFEEYGTSTVFDGSGYGHTGMMYASGTISDFHSNSNCKVGSCCLDLDSSSRRVVNVADKASLSPGKITIAAWVNPSAFTGSLINKEEEYRLIASDVSVNKISVRYTTYNTAWASGTGSGRTNLVTGSWQMVGATYDGSNWAFYLNGQLDGIKADSGLLKRRGGPFQLQFGQTYNSQSFFSGKVDDLRIYNTALSAAEVQALYDATK